MNSRIHKRPRLSPLRYPGGKAALYPFLRALIRSQNLTSGTYIEPYAGGAGAALGLLLTGQVEQIVINDLDPAIYSFWLASTKYARDLAKLVDEAKLNVDEWDRQKAIYRAKDLSDPVALGFATFYLNRTNRSGVLNAGPIGGRDQTGNYKISARFNKETLLERLRLIALYSSKINVRNDDGINIIAEYSLRPSTFIYADPPYFEKAGSLYMNSFKPDDHASLASCLNSRASSQWLLTYDNVPDVETLYCERRRELIPVNYSGHRASRVKEVMVFSDALSLHLKYA